MENFQDFVEGSTLQSIKKKKSEARKGLLFFILFVPLVLGSIVGILALTLFFSWSIWIGVGLLLLVLSIFIFGSAYLSDRYSPLLTKESLILFLTQSSIHLKSFVESGYEQKYLRKARKNLRKAKRRLQFRSLPHGGFITGKQLSRALNLLEEYIKNKALPKLKKKNLAKQDLESFQNRLNSIVLHLVDEKVDKLLVDLEEIKFPETEPFYHKLIRPESRVISYVLSLFVFLIVAGVIYELSSFLGQPIGFIPSLAFAAPIVIGVVTLGEKFHVNAE